jgi:hypothetical protein
MMSCVMKACDRPTPCAFFRQLICWVRIPVLPVLRSRLMMSGDWSRRYPIGAVIVQVDPDMLDVNLDPNKEVHQSVNVLPLFAL